MLQGTVTCPASSMGTILDVPPRRLEHQGDASSRSVSPAPPLDMPLSPLGEPLLLPPTPEHWLEMSAAHMRGPPAFMRPLPASAGAFLQVPQTAYSTLPATAPSLHPGMHMALSMPVPTQPLPIGQDAVAYPSVSQVLCLDKALSLPGDAAERTYPSLGSALHALGTCKPCAFFHKKGCEKGPECSFCHLCDDEEVKKRKREKKDKLRELKLQVRQAGA